MWVSYLAYPNLLGTKGLVVVVVVVLPCFPDNDASTELMLHCAVVNRALILMRFSVSRESIEALPISMKIKCRHILET